MDRSPGLSGRRPLTGLTVSRCHLQPAAGAVSPFRDLQMFTETGFLLEVKWDGMLASVVSSGVILC